MLQMRFTLPALLVLVSGCSTLSAQPRVGIVEIYGAHRLPQDKIRKALGVRTGDPLPRSKGDIEDRLESIDGVLRARLEAFCCDQGNAVLYVGIEERGTVPVQFHDWPDQPDLALPEEIIKAYNDFSAALGRASAHNDLKEDLSAGHSLMEDLPTRIAQGRFVGLANLHLDHLRHVLKNSGSSEQRSIAAYVIGYAPKKSDVVKDLQSALQDPDGGVRANAARSLKAIIYAGMRDPELGIRVQPTWFIEMANSIELGDRLEAIRILLLYTEKRDESAIAAIRDRALPSILEMARWQYLPHALPAFFLAGRLADLPDDEIQSVWSSGNREKTLIALEKSLRKK